MKNYRSGYLMDATDSVSFGESFLVAYCFLNKNEAKDLFFYYGA
jgi:hypothetical protein